MRARSLVLALLLASPLAAQPVQTGAYQAQAPGGATLTLASWREATDDGQWRHWFTGTAVSLEQAWGTVFRVGNSGGTTVFTFAATRGWLFDATGATGAAPWADLTLWTFTGAQASDGPYTFTSGAFVLGTATVAAPTTLGVTAAYRVCHVGGTLDGHCDRDNGSGHWTLAAAPLPDAVAASDASAVSAASTTTAPEPATWALLGAGLAGVGALARRRRA